MASFNVEKLFILSILFVLLGISHASYPPSTACTVRRFRFSPRYGLFVAVVRCQCYGGKTKVDSVIRSDSPKVTQGLLKCAKRNADRIQALCVEKEQSNFPVTVLPVADLCCTEAGGSLVGDVCNKVY